MKHEIIGRGFSREHVITGDIEDDPDEIHAYLKEVSEDDTMQHLEPIDRARALGASYLKSMGLPTALLLHQRDPGGDWIPGKPNNDDYIAIRSLDLHIKDLGFARDSLPDLAARLILEAENTEREENGLINKDQATRESMLKHWYFELGRLIGLWGAYLKVADGRAMRGKSKRRVWAERAAEKVTHWHQLPGRDDDPFEFEDLFVKVFADGDTLVASDLYAPDAPEKTLARSTFEKRYLKK